MTFSCVNAAVLMVEEVVVVVGMMVTLMYFGRAPHTLENGQAVSVDGGCGKSDIKFRRGDMHRLCKESGQGKGITCKLHS